MSPDASPIVELKQHFSLRSKRRKHCQAENLDFLSSFSPLTICEPVFGKPILKIESAGRKIIAVADIHLGYEAGLLKKGLIIKSRVDEILDEILDVLACEKPDHFIIVGDLKDELFGTGAGTEYRLTRFFSRLENAVGKITVVKGNHDGRIEDVLPADVELIGFRGGVVENVGFFHGHSWPLAEVLEAPLVVTAHNHATFSSILAGEKYFYHPCWVRGKLDAKKVMEHYPDADPVKIAEGEFILLPSFTKTGKGVVVNGDGSFLGPVLSNGLLLEGDARVYLLDGTDLGCLGE